MNSVSVIFASAMLASLSSAALPGSLDASFNGSGIAITPVGSNLDAAYDLIVQNDGKVVVVGWAAGGNAAFAVVRYHPDGSLDTGFGTTGKVIVDFGTGND